MEFPIIFFLYIYIAFLVVWGVLFFIALYHMFRFSFRTYTSVMVVVIFLAVASLMLNASWQLIGDIDWQEQVSFFSSMTENKLPF